VREVPGRGRASRGVGGFQAHAVPRDLPNEATLQQIVVGDAFTRMVLSPLPFRALRAGWTAGADYRTKPNASKSNCFKHLAESGRGAQAGQEHELDLQNEAKGPEIVTGQ
jgi:hypothetical protein